MKKYILNFRVDINETLSSGYGLLKLSPIGQELPEMQPGQFVQIEVNGAKNTFLRRPISICRIDKANNQLWLLIRKAGEGTSQLLESVESDIINIICPLGNGFSLNKSDILLIGGGVGVAPLLYYGEQLKKSGITPSFLLAAKSQKDLLLIDEFKELGPVYISTDDGSVGEKGLITSNTILKTGNFKNYACCGPMPMMRAIAKIARTNGIECEVSLENVMACGLGACLCCVEDTKDEGNVCVCKEGPVFNINRLKW